MSKNTSRFAAAVVLYIGFSIYLYRPHLHGFAPEKFLCIINTSLAATGCFMLSRRWLLSFPGLLLAGALYGFGPYLLSLGRYHPAAGLLVASIPWLFCPAAYLPKKIRHNWLQIPLSLLLFIVTPVFFEALSLLRIFPVPIQARLGFKELTGFFVPLVMAQNNLNLIGFYHIPVAALIIGISMLIGAKRYGVISIACIGFVLSVIPALGNTSPTIWLSLPVLVCSVITGAGLQGLLSAPASDKKWFLISTAVLAVLSIAAMVPTTKLLQIPEFVGSAYILLFTQTAKIYVAGAITVFLVYLIVRSNIRLFALRTAILCSAMAVDIFFGARFIVDKIL
jgi:hypothetical protein